MSKPIHDPLSKRFDEDSQIEVKEYHLLHVCLPLRHTRDACAMVKSVISRVTPIIRSTRV